MKLALAFQLGDQRVRALWKPDLDKSEGIQHGMGSDRARSEFIGHALDRHLDLYVSLPTLRWNVTLADLSRVGKKELKMVQPPDSHQVCLHDRRENEPMEKAKRSTFCRRKHANVTGSVIMWLEGVKEHEWLWTPSTCPGQGVVRTRRNCHFKDTEESLETSLTDVEVLDVLLANHDRHHMYSVSQKTTNGPKSFGFLALDVGKGLPWDVASLDARLQIEKHEPAGPYSVVQMIKHIEMWCALRCSTIKALDALATDATFESAFTQHLYNLGGGGDLKDKRFINLDFLAIRNRARAITDVIHSTCNMQ